MSILRLLTYIGAATAAQIPLQYSSGAQATLNPAGKSGLVTSSGLQSDITIDKLLNRAKQLSKIADLGFDEYNHPTRVIGSKGDIYLVSCDCFMTHHSGRPSWYN